MKKGAGKMVDTTNTNLMWAKGGGDVIATRDTTKEKEVFGTTRYKMIN